MISFLSRESVLLSQRYLLVAIACAFGYNASSAVAVSPDGLWKFNETSGTTAADSSGNAYHGTTVYSPTWNPDGKSTGAITLIADANDRVTLPAAVAHNASDFTFAAWFRTTKTTGSNAILSGANSSNNNELTLYLANAGATVTFTTGENASSNVSWNLSSSLADGTWHHVAVVRNDVNDKVTLYIDGESKGELTTTLSTLTIDTGGLVLGEEQDTVGGAFTTAEAFAGSLDDVRIYRSALTATDVDAIVNRQVLLLVIASSSADSEELLRANQFESWNYMVSTIEDSSTQSAFDAAVALADVVYIPNTLTETSISNKLRLAAAGVVSEYPEVDDEMGFGTSNGGQSNKTQIQVYNNTHPVTLGFASGAVTIFGSSAKMAFVQGTPAPAGVGLAYLFTTSAPDLMAIEEGGQLSNTQLSNTYAAGRRVRLPYGHNTYSWSNHNATGLTLIQQALEWASEHAGLKGHWKLDETSGTTAVDSSDSEKNGTYTNGATPGFTGVRGYAADFDGTNDYITISGGTEYNIRQSFTIACWAKSDTATWSGWGCLVSKRNQFYLHPSVGGTSLYIGADVAGAGDASAGFDMANIGSIQHWHHYLGVYDYEEGQVRLYVDGVLRATTSVTLGTLLESDTGALTIGWDDGIGGTRYFDGQIDDVYLYDKALSDAEIAELYGLIGHWKFDETSGSVAADSSGIGSDMNLWNGVVVGAAGPYPGDGAIAADFDGIDDNASVPIADAHDNITEYVSVAGWVKFDTAIADQTEQNRILIRSDWDTQRGFALLADQPLGDRLLFRVLNGTTFAQASWVNPEIEAGKWYHIVGTYDGFNVKLYVDGDLKVSTPFTSPIEPYNDDKIRFGNKLDGRMHDLRLYNRAITEAEIAEIYGLVAHWKLDETSGSFAADSTGMGHDAVLTGLEGWTTDGQVDGAFTFDYADGDDYFVAPATPTLNNLTDDSHSVMAWFKPRSVPPQTGSHNNAYYAVLMKPGLHSGIAYEYSAYAFFSTWDSSSNQIGAASSTTLPSGKFYHLAAVLDRDNGVVSFYVDGVFQSSSTFTPGVTLRDYASDPWRIGIGSPGTSTWSWPAHATIDDAKLYNRPLGADEVLKIYESGQTKGIRIIRWVEAR